MNTGRSMRALGIGGLYSHSVPTVLQSLLEPVTPTAFREQYYGQQPLLIPGRPDKFASLFTWDDLNRLLNASRFPHPQIFTAQSKQASSAESLVEDCRAGASVIVNRINEFDPNVGALVRALEAETGEPMNVNLYLSQPSRAAFPRHFDRHDVLVLQIHGHKAWQVCERTLEKPIYEMVEDSHTAPTETILECELAPGDVLYIPRGHWHNALAQRGMSLHLTLGINARTGIDFLKWVTDQARSDVRFRHELPLSFSDELVDARDARLREHVAGLAEALAARLADPQTVRDFEKYRVLADRDFRRFKLPEQLLESPASQLGLRQFSRPSYQRALVEEGELLSLNVWGNIFQFSLAASALVAFILSKTDFTFDEAMSHRGELTEAGVWEVLDPLVREGILDASP